MTLAAMGGDRRAMETLWCEHRGWVAAVLLAHKSVDDHLDDLLQDVAMTVVSKIDTLRDPQHLRSWLRTVAINTARASARSGKVRPWHRPRGEAPETQVEPTPDPNLLDEEAQRLLEVVRSLPEAYREPLMLRAVQGMRGRHISRIMGLSEATVETRIARARRMVRERLNSTEAMTGADIGPLRVNWRSKQ